MTSQIRLLGDQARRASRKLASAGRSSKDEALHAIAGSLRSRAEEIARVNARDVEAARAAGLQEAMIDRLIMSPKVIEATARGVEHVATLDDPVGSRGEMRRLPSGIRVGRQRLPLGVIAMIYESRPNVTIDSAALCLKSGNAVLLRGGKEARETNVLLGQLVQAALVATGLPAEAVQIVPATDRESIRELIGLTGLVDLAIPRGGEGLIRFVSENARVPVVQHYKGVCHLFMDETGDPEMGVRLAVNGKARPGVCNALECVLVHEAQASAFLPQLGAALAAEGVEIRACPRTLAFIPSARPATDSDWGTEYLAKIVAVRVVRDIDEALAHVERYGSNHTEAICTDSQQRAERWLQEVDASCVLVNASTRFNDGGELGLGAEIGISTSKLHAYGPMGLESLTTEKWIVLGEGQIRR